MQDTNNENNVQSQPTLQSQYGEQGNEGLYGQGQYTAEGTPDPNSAQVQRAKPESPEKLEQQAEHAGNPADGTTRNSDTLQQQNQEKQDQEDPIQSSNQ